MTSDLEPTYFLLNYLIIVLYLKMTDPYENTSPEVLEQALELMGDMEAADFDELLKSVAYNVTGAQPIPDTLLSDIPRTTPPRVGRTTSRSQRVARPLGSIRSGIRPGKFIARKSPRNPIPLSPQVRVINQQNTPSTGRSSRSGLQWYSSKFYLRLVTWNPF